MNTLEQAVDFHRSGELDKARKIYETLLSVNERNPEALHLLGLLLCSQRDHDRAIELIELADSISPNNAVYLGNLGVAYRKANRFEDAITAYQKAIALQPDKVENHFHLGKSLVQLGRPGDARTAFQRAIKLKPNDSAAWLSLMNLAAKEKDLPQAVELGRKAVAACPGKAELLVNLGVMLKRSGEAENSIDSFRKAVAVEPQNVQALSRLAIALLGSRKLKEAKQYLDRAIKIDDKSLYVYEAQAGYYTQTNQDQLAVQAYESAMAVDPEHAPVLIGLAAMYRKSGMLTRALELSTRGLEKQPENGLALANHGLLLVRLGRHLEAEQVIRKGLIQTQYGNLDSALLMCLQYKPGINAASLLTEHQNWYQNLQQTVPESYKKPASRKPASRLKIGFVSPDLGNHPIGFFTVGLFENLDQELVETFVYNDKPRDEPITLRIKTAAEHWQDVFEEDDDSLTEIIRRDELDILFDLTGHTGRNRLQVFARRAAPIQISWAGYVGTTGLRTMDYLLADDFHTPAGCEANYGEKILRMPGCYVSYNPPEDLPPVGALPAIRNQFLTFGSFCNPAKVNSDVLERWAKIFCHFQGSSLLFCYRDWPDPTNRERVLKTFSQQRVDLKVSFLAENTAVQTMARYGEVDVALDTFPYSGGLTTAEAMHMGVPTITWPGDTFAGRHSLSHLTNADLASPWVVPAGHDTTQELIDVLSDHERLAAIRNRLSERRTSVSERNREFATNFQRIMQEVVDTA